MVVVRMVAALVAALSMLGAWAGPAEAPVAASPAAQALVRWAVAGDAVGRPFAVVDKPQARIHVFGADGRLRGSAPALLGLARGDQSAPGVGARVRSGIAPEQRTTPAGRFASEPGRNLRGEALVWVDYDAAVAIHRLRPADPAEQRPQRLASATPDDNRISLGCIVVDAAFYDSVVAPSLGRQRGVVYVLPDSGDWTLLFSGAAGH
jgi:hypothetical protein